MSGAIIGRLTVLHRVPPPNRDTYWQCQCACGRVVIVSGCNLRRNNTRSCGCLKRERVRHMNTRHGASRTVEYAAWLGAKARCHNPANRYYKDYGGRGITMCNAWRADFAAFLRDMGRKPSSEYSLERKDVNSGYEPGNTCWATRLDQANNKRTNHRLHTGETLAQAARRMGLNYGTITKRIRSDWSESDILTVPVRSHHYLTLNGVTRTLTQWARHLKMPTETLAKRLRSGWTVKRALTAPVQQQDRLLTFRRKTQSVSAWAKEVGLNRMTLFARLDHGWSTRDALFSPVDNHR